MQEHQQDRKSQESGQERHKVERKARDDRQEEVKHGMSFVGLLEAALLVMELTEAAAQKFPGVCRGGGMRRSFSKTIV